MKNENFISRIVQAFRPTNNADRYPIESLNVTSLQDLRSMSRYQVDHYDNGYSSVRAIADQYLQIRPFAIDNNGAKIDPTPAALRALSRPNTEMSSVQFRDMWATKVQVFDKIYVLVHERDGTKTKPASENVKEERIAGYTFLHGVVEDYSLGYLRYQVYNPRTALNDYYEKYQVITDYDTNPAQVGQGYSPARAARRWTRIEDYIADYQAGFFENGAVPAGQFIITAPTDKEFNDIVDGLEKKHKGADKSNNVVYTYQPIDPNSGKPSQATITWVPFNTNNKDLALKDILEAVDAKTDSVYRVSAMQRAITDAPNFATAQVDDRNFTEKTLRPFTLKRYQRIQHELNRITGGLGYGISFKLDTPYIAEESKAIAETNSIISTTLNNLVTVQGYTLDSVIDAMDLSPRWKLLKKGTSDTTTIKNDKAEVVETGEEDDSPTPTARKRSKNPKAKATDEDKLFSAARSFMKVQVDRAVEELSEEVTNAVNADPTEAEQEAFIRNMIATITGILIANGEDQYSVGAALASYSLDELTGFNLKDDAIDAYEVYLHNVAGSYGNDTAESIRKVLLEANNNGLSRKETADALRNILNTDEYRITRLARSELNNSSNIGKLEGMKELEAEVGLEFEKTIDHSGTTPCPLCASQEGVWTTISQPLWGYGSSIQTTDEKGEPVTYVNDWMSLEAQDYHANGRGSLVFRRKQ